MNQSLTRKLTTVACVIVLGAILIWRGFYLPSDDEMIDNFRRNKAKFEAVVHMFKEDGQNMWIASYFGSWAANKTAKPDLSAARVEEYRVLLRGLNVTGVVGQAGKSAAFQIYAPLYMTAGPVKSYRYLPDWSPQSMLSMTTSETGAHQFQAGEWRVVCRLIDTDWYVCIDYED